MYQGNYPGSYLGNYPGNYPGNYSGSYPGNYPGGQQVQYYHCPTCGTPIQVIYVPAAQPNLNTLAILLIAVLILIAIDIVFLRGR